MLQLKGLGEERSLDSRRSLGTRILAGCSFLERYDSKKVRVWGSVNDMKGKDLEEVEAIWEVEGFKRRARSAAICAEDREWGLANMGGRIAWK